MKTIRPTLTAEQVAAVMQPVAFRLMNPYDQRSATPIAGEPASRWHLPIRFNEAPALIEEVAGEVGIPARGPHPIVPHIVASDELMATLARHLSIYALGEDLHERFAIDVRPRPGQALDGSGDSFRLVATVAHRRFIGSAFAEISRADALALARRCVEQVRDAMRREDPAAMIDLSPSDWVRTYEEAKSAAPGLAMVPTATRTAEVCAAAVKANAFNLKSVPQQLKTPELCLHAVTTRGSTLQWVPAELQTPELCKAAIDQSAWALQFVAEKTADLCLQACLKDRDTAIEFVPTEMRTELARSLNLALAGKATPAAAPATTAEQPAPAAPARRKRTADQTSSTKAPLSAEDAAVLSEMRLMSVDGLFIRLPQTQLTHYAEIRKRMLDAGGSYSKDRVSPLFKFKEGTDVPAIFEALTSGVSKNIKQETQFFATPQAEAEAAAESLCILYGESGLEPSAGDGALADQMKAAGAQVTTVENWSVNVTALRAKGYTPLDKDFLQVTHADLPEAFDFVLANPPFSKGQDMKHFSHALSFLKPDGRIAAIVSRGSLHNSTKAHKAFQKVLNLASADTTEIEAGAFAKSGTQVATTRVNLHMFDLLAALEAEGLDGSTLGLDLSRVWALKQAADEREAVENRQHQRNA